MRSTNLVPLLGPGDNPGLGVRQGVIVSWNPDTGENLVQVAGTLMENLNLLNTSEASLFVPGDVVTILTLPGTWGILGRMTIPGTPAAVTAFQSVTNRIQVASDANSGTRNSATYGDLTGAAVGPAVTIRISSTGRALVFWSAEIGQTGVAMHDLSPHVGVEVSGATTIAANAQNALNFEYLDSTGGQTAEFQAWFQMGTFHVFTGLNPGNNTFTLKYRHDGITPSTNINFEAREIAVFAL